MIYRSNLAAPDLSPYFRLKEFDHIGGHTFLGDPDFDPRCGFFTHDEAAILYNLACAVTRRAPANLWLDIGARTGWTAAHVIAGGGAVVALEPEYYRAEFKNRALENIGPVRGKYAHGQPVFLPWAFRSKEFFEMRSAEMNAAVHSFTPPKFDGFIIDGNHDEPEPLRDAQNGLCHAQPSAVFVIHDFQGPATFQAAEYLIEQGCKCRVYWTPNVIAVCWRGFDGWTPPDHKPDPEIMRALRGVVASHFDLKRCV